MSRRAAFNAAICGALVLGTAVVYWPALGCGFVNFDDDVYVTLNPRVSAGLTADGLRWAWTSSHAANWHPLAWMSHMLDVSAFGLEPRGHHLTSVVLHALNATLLFALLRHLTGAPGRSAVVAALFAFHPLHVESVAWVAERKDVLSTLFWFLTLAAYARYAAAPTWSRYSPVFALLGLGLCAKPMLVSVPFVLLLLDVWPLDRARLGWRRLAVEKLPLLALSLASSVVTVFAQRADGAIQSIEHSPILVRAANAAFAYVAYLGKTVWPRGLAVFYPYPERPAAWWVVVACVALLAGTTLGVFRLRRRSPYLLVGWLWYLGTLVPVIGLVQVGEQSMADRYTYVPLVGIFLAATWGTGELLSRFRPAPWPALAAAVPLLAFAVVARAQVQHWTDSVTLFRHAVEVTRGNHTAHLNLAMALADRGEYPPALTHYRRALELRPDSAKTHNNLGVALDRSGSPAEALHHYREAARHDPGYADAHLNLGIALAGAGHREEAIAALERAAQADPDSLQAHYNCGTLLAEAGRWAEATVYLRRAIAIAPDDASARFNLALALHFMGESEVAWQELEVARRLGFVPAPEAVEMFKARPRVGS